MLWAACCIAFFGILRIGEMIVPSKDAYDPSVHLNLSDVSVDNLERPTMLKISIKQSKTDPFQKGVDLFLGKTDTDISPVRALQKAGVDQLKYCGHSLRIGGAITAAAREMEDSIIKTLGRWQSMAYLQYVRISRSQLEAYSKLLCS